MLLLEDSTDVIEIGDRIDSGSECFIPALMYVVKMIVNTSYALTPWTKDKATIGVRWVTTLEVMKGGYLT